MAEDRFREAPTCSESQVFTTANCRITLDGTMVSLTSGEAELNLGGRHVSASVSLAGEISDVSGQPVQVTLYRGKVIHFEGQRLKVDTEAAPATDYRNFRNGGMSAIIGGSLLVGATALVRAIDRLGSPVGPEGASRWFGKTMSS